MSRGKRVKEKERRPKQGGGRKERLSSRLPDARPARLGWGEKGGPAPEISGICKRRGRVDKVVVQMNVGGKAHLQKKGKKGGAGGQDSFKKVGAGESRSYGWNKQG